MIELFDTYWPIVLAALLVGLLVGYLIFRPRQRVRLSDATPVRPHMAAPRDSQDDVAGPTLTAPPPADLPPTSGPPDSLEKLKGVGPKLASMLNARGLTRFDQIARLSAQDVDRLDEHLGAFRGRLRRDRIVEQADYLARGDIDGFERTFGKL